MTPSPDEDPEVALAHQREQDFIHAKSGEFFSFAEGETESLAEAPLWPWTPPRKIAAQSMGMLYPLIGDEGFEQLARTGHYPGAMKDTIIFLWLRFPVPVFDPALKTSRPENLAEAIARADRAQSRPKLAWAAASAWAEEHGLLDLAAPAFQRAYDLFSAKMQAEQEARAVPKIPPGGNAEAASQKKSNSGPVGGLPHDGGGDQQ